MIYYFTIRKSYNNNLSRRIFCSSNLNLLFHLKYPYCVVNRCLFSTPSKTQEKKKVFNPSNRSILPPTRCVLDFTTSGRHHFIKAIHHFRPCSSRNLGKTNHDRTKPTSQLEVVDLQNAYSQSRTKNRY